MIPFSLASFVVRQDADVGSGSKCGIPFRTLLRVASRVEITHNISHKIRMSKPQCQWPWIFLVICLVHANIIHHQQYTNSPPLPCPLCIISKATLPLVTYSYHSIYGVGAAELPLAFSEATKEATALPAPPLAAGILMRHKTSYGILCESLYGESHAL